MKAVKLIPDQLINDIALEVDPEEQRRLDECVLEPIRMPGAIQPHGVLIGLDPETLVVTVASDNCEPVFGRPAASLLGLPAESLFGTSFSLSLDYNPIPFEAGGRRYDAIIEHGETLLTIDLEPRLNAPPVAALHAAALRLATVKTREDLWRETAHEIRALTGFDRVMVYHYHPDEHGEVVAEERAEGMESYLGLHYPASDIPAQARALYVTKLSRGIVSTEDDAVALLSSTAAPIDLSNSELRAVSPHHLEFMRNMGQASTLSLSLVHDGRLVGMITCAHRTRRRLPFAFRRGLEVIANQVALQLESMLAITLLTRAVALADIRSRLLAERSSATDLADALLRGELTVLDLIAADGAVLRLEGSAVSVGVAPPAAQVDEVVARVGASLVTDALPLEHPELIDLVPDAAGMLLLPVGGAGDYIAFFRREVVQSVNWLGEQTSANRESPLSPRTSFSSWTHEVSGHSLPWGDLPHEAGELARDLESALLRRAESKLAAVAMSDPLTGLPNRRLLMDRLEHALTRLSREQPLALLFIDLDGFKAVNDTEGHEVGDALLVQVAVRLTEATRASDTVARLGGDEYVVLCENTSATDAELVAARVVRDLREPVVVNGRTVGVTASVGVMSAVQGMTASELLRDADAAMYRAKASGRDRVAR